ncbi:MAG: hypothetical protein R8L58_01260 [Mariprofundaceae bacterium]
MSLIWCIRRGKEHGFQNELTACVSCQCRKRRQCKPYAELPAEQLIAAQREAAAHGHEVVGAMPLFNAAQRSGR